jgi:hypothetical protein
MCCIFGFGLFGASLVALLLACVCAGSRAFSFGRVEVEVKSQKERRSSESSPQVSIHHVMAFIANLFVLSNCNSCPVISNIICSGYVCVDAAVLLQVVTRHVVLLAILQREVSVHTDAHADRIKQFLAENLLR